MKQNYFLLVLLLSIISSTTYSQTIKISNVKYSGGSAISGGAIEIPQGSSVKIDFTVEYNTGGIDYGGSANIGIMMPGSSMITSVLGTMAISPRYQGSQTFTNKTLSASNYPDGSTLLAEMSIPNYGTTKSNKIPIKIKYKPVDNNTVTGNQSVGSETIPSTLIGSTPTGGNGQYKYQWQHRKSGNWSNISNAAGKNYQPPTLKETTKYRRIVTSGNSENSTSNEVTITFVPINNSISGDQTILYGQRATVTGNQASGGEGSPTYKWQEKKGSSWQDIRAASKDYNFIARETHQLRRLALFGKIIGASNVITITVKHEGPIKNNSITGNQTIEYNSIPSEIIGSTPNGGNGNYTYMWQTKDYNASSWRSIYNSNSKNYTLQEKFKITTQYRRIVRSTGAENSYSNVITITVKEPTAIITNNTISGDQTIDINKTPAIVNGSIPQGGNGNYTYQWQKHTGNRRFSDIAGETSKDFQPPKFPSSSINTYRRVVYTYGAEENISNTVSIQVNSPSSRIDNTINSKSSVERVDTNSTFQIYPNPSTNGIINLSYEIGETSLPKAKVAIYSGSSGQKLYDKDVKITNSKIQTEINIPNYRSNDIYIVKFHIGNATITKRVILK
ncbi:T9SS type A sorting domain-containing protein [Sinomicrobium sp. M5D2P9]